MIYIGADHRGFELKNKIKNFLEEFGYDYKDLGTFEYNKDDDYPDFAEAVAEKVAANAGDRGILICGSDIGVAIVANRIKGIRAGGATNAKQIAAARNDDDINILALGADFLSEEETKEIVKTFLETKFSNEERHKRRILKIEN